MQLCCNFLNENSVATSSLQDVELNCQDDKIFLAVSKPLVVESHLPPDNIERKNVLTVTESLENNIRMNESVSNVWNQKVQLTIGAAPESNVCVMAVYPDMCLSPTHSVEVFNEIVQQLKPYSDDSISTLDTNVAARILILT